MNAKRILSIVLCLLLTVMLFAGCGETKEKVLIYTSIEDYVLEDLQECLNEKFPDYNIVIEYMSTGDHAAKLISEGATTACDITYNLEYPNLQKLDKKGLLAKINENLEEVGKTLGISRFRMIKDVFLPQSISTLAEMFLYFFVNSMMTISAVSFLANTSTKPISLMINQFEAQMQLGNAGIVSLFILIINLLLHGTIALVKRKINKA